MGVAWREWDLLR